MDLQTKLEQLFQQNNDTIKKVKSLDELNQIRVQLLGKKGPITGVLRGMKDLSAEERPKSARSPTKFATISVAVIEARKAQLEQAVINAKLASETVDVTCSGDPGWRPAQPHITTQIVDDPEGFYGHGLQLLTGPRSWRRSL